MSKNEPKINFHYGQKEFGDIMLNIAKIKLQEVNIEVNDKNNNHTSTVYNEKSKR